MKQEDVDTIVRAFEDQYAAAFNRKDAKALAALLTEDVTLLSEWGDIVQGRATIARCRTRGRTAPDANPGVEEKTRDPT